MDVTNTGSTSLRLRKNGILEIFFLFCSPSHERAEGQATASTTKGKEGKMEPEYMKKRTQLL